MKVKELLQAMLVNNLPAGILGLAGFLLGKPIMDLMHLAYVFLLPHISYNTLLRMLTSTTLLCLILIGYLIYKFFKNRPRLTEQFGVYWDKKLNPYCPSCFPEKRLKMRVRAAATNDRGAFLECLKCQKTAIIRQISVKVWTPEEAQKYVGAQPRDEWI